VRIASRFRFTSAQTILQSDYSDKNRLFSRVENEVARMGIGIVPLASWNVGGTGSWRLREATRVFFNTYCTPFQWTFCGSARDRSHGTIKVLHRRAARERNVRRAQSCSRDFSSLVAKLFRRSRRGIVILVPTGVRK
jgi:hypothetical protein